MKPQDGMPAGRRAILLALCMAAVLWVSLTGSLSSPLEVPRLMLLAGLFLTIRVFFMKNISSPTGSGAIVMALGIFINGALIHFPVLNADLGRSLAVILFILFLFIAGSYIRDAVQKKAYTAHFADPVGSFAIGTWIAGTSVCGIVVCGRLPAWIPLVQVLFIGSIGLWFCFICRAGKSFLHFFESEAWRKVHGILFLSTVSTQSLILFWKAAFGAGAGYRLTAPWAILLGLIFYCMSFYLVARRYICEGRDLDLDRNWFNTNCITHGAMSITGLASAVSGVVPPVLTLLIWLWAISCFVVVEIIEIVRAVKRTRIYGMADGLLVYNPSQWSRNFTFGMLYAFTLNFDITQSAAVGRLLLPLHQMVLHSFAWLVLALLIFEIFVFFRDRLSLSVPAVRARS
ncbi:MAG: hypothetical protein P4L42_13335 [Desulfocapsaceae bacterium]|nr:hypothetical protein [Desulfocapsaceae bacterium]